jgi:uncharacterized membrane protein
MFGGDNLTRTMSRTSSQRSVRNIRRSVRWHALQEYVGGALWVLPSAAALIALVVGFGISQIEIPPQLQTELADVARSTPAASSNPPPLLDGG